MPVKTGKRRRLSPAGKHSQVPIRSRFVQGHAGSTSPFLRNPGRAEERGRQSRLAQQQRPSVTLAQSQNLFSRPDAKPAKETAGNKTHSSFNGLPVGTRQPRSGPSEESARLSNTSDGCCPPAFRLVTCHLPLVACSLACPLDLPRRPYYDSFCEQGRIGCWECTGQMA